MGNAIENRSEFWYFFKHFCCFFCQIHRKDLAKIPQRSGKDTAKISQRHHKDITKTPQITPYTTKTLHPPPLPKSGKDTAKVRQRYCKDTAKIWQRHSKDTAKTWQRHCKDLAKILQRHRKIHQKTLQSPPRRKDTAQRQCKHGAFEVHWSL